MVTILALHGNGGGAFRFHRVPPFMPADVRLQAMTLPGFAGKPSDPSLQTVTDYAQYVYETARLEGDPLVLLGTGIGGSIALEYAQHYALTLAGLILHAPVGTRLDNRLFPRLMKLPGMRRTGQWVFSARLTRPLFRRMLFTQPLPSEVSERFFSEYRQCQVFGQMFDLITADWFASLRPIHTPAALLWGERERVLGVDQLADYKALLPRHLVRVVPDWNHFPMLDQPEAFAREVATLARQLITM